MDEVPPLTSKSINALTNGTIEIRKALQILAKSHGLTLCQVWILRTLKNTNVECAFKFDGYHADAFKDYYDACVNIQDGPGELALKTLETYQSYFSRNLINGKLQALIPATSASESSCCLAIVLRNIYSGDFDYAFEFFFSSYHNNNNNPCVFLDSLFLKLETCLPSFKFSCGAQLGRQLLVTDSDNLTERFDILGSKKQEESCQCLPPQRSVRITFEDALKLATLEIQEALSSLTESLNLTLCQVWTHRYVNNECAECAVKLDGYYDATFKDYYDACVKIQDGTGGLAFKSLVTYAPYFSRNINIIKGKLHALIPATSSESCCFVICLRNMNTRNLDYAFEFIFSLHDNQDPYVFLDSLLLKLKTCFPSFKLSFGSQLGQQLQVLDGDNLAANFDFLAFLNQEDDDEDCMKEQLGTLIETDLKANNTGALRAMAVPVYVPASLEFVDLKTKVSETFRLVSKSYRLIYFLESGSNGSVWARLKDDEDLKTCVGYFREHRINRILIRVLPRDILNPES